MYKQKKNRLLFLLVLVWGSSWSQISMAPSNIGCLPGIANATLSYNGPPATNINWNFGDGSPPSNLPQPIHSYLSVGSYTVTFNGNVGGNQQTYTLLVTVNPPPTGNFNMTVPNNICLPVTVTYTASSPSSNIAFIWDYGDNNLGNGITSTHTYNSPGLFTPILTIQNTITSCFVNITGSQIVVSAQPQINISANPGLNSCNPPFTTAFTGSNSVSYSPNGGGLSYSWNFGAGTPGISGSATPGNVTFNQGVHTVSLTCTDNLGCSKTGTVNVSVISPTVNAIVPAAVCINTQLPTYNGYPNFTISIQASEPSSFWQMGDGSTLTIPSPTVIPPYPPLSPIAMQTHTVPPYSTPGIKTITITVNKNGCITNITRTIAVVQITPTFVTAPPSGTYCNAPLLFSCNNISSINFNPAGPLIYNWYVSQYNAQFPTPFTSTLTNPSFTLPVGSLNPYTLYSGFTPEITLVAESQPLLFWHTPLKCSAVYNEKPYFILRPTAYFVFDNGEGCAPLSVTYTSTSVTHSLFPVTNYTWYNGATGVNAFSVTGNGPTIPNFSFTYTAPGVYSPSLVIDTQGGCTSTSFVGTITVVNPPTFSINLPATPSICVGAPYMPTLTPTGGSNIDHWHLESDFGYFSNCVSDLTPTWSFSHPGVHGFTISAYQNSCKTTSVLAQTIAVKGPLAKLRFETNCTNKKVVNFHYRLEDAQNAVLNFGDGNNANIVAAPGNTATGIVTHTYNSTGDYTATLIGSNGANFCPVFTHSQLVTVRQMSIDFSLSFTVSCKGGFAPIATVTSTTDVLKGCGRGYTWFYDNLQALQTSSEIMTNNVHTFTTLGNHTIKLLTRDVNNCTEELTKIFRVSSPTPTFNFNSNPLCVSNYPGQIINLTPQNPDPVLDYVIGFTTTLPNGTYSTIAYGTTNNPVYSPTFAFNLGLSQTKNYTVTMYATNTAGCMSKLTKELVINNPVASFNFIPNICDGDNVQFNIPAAPSHINYFLQFGDGTQISTNTNTITHTYSSFNPTTLITPTLTITDNGGCTAKYTQSFVVQRLPVASFTLTNILDPTRSGPDFCMPVTLKYTSTSYSPSLLYYFWTAGNGAGTSIGTVNIGGATYTASGQYVVKLQVNTTAGCSSTYSLPVNIYNPKIDFEIDKDIICLGDAITVDIDSKKKSGVSLWVWSFGDNTFQPDQFFQHQLPKTYNINTFNEGTNGVLTIQLTGYTPQHNQFACVDIATKTITVVKISSGFDRNNELTLRDTTHCLNVEDKFTNKSKSNLSSALTFTWSFGDGGISNAPNPAYTYTLPGVYQVKLRTLIAVPGCEANSTKNMTVFPSPTASLDVADKACPLAPFVIRGSGVPGTGNGLISGTLIPSSAPLSFLPNNTFLLQSNLKTSTTYSLIVSDENGCVSKPVSDSIFIIAPPRQINWDTTIIIGSTVALNAWVGPGYTYTWTPLVTSLNCDTCLTFNPISNTTVNITYTVLIEDDTKCSITPGRFKINVDPRTTIDVPSAFTPNGDGANDEIFPDGWGIRKLLYFRVYNRWGQLLFETDVFKQGWDGKFNGTPQNMETYVYQVSAETYVKEIPTITRSGTFKLLR